MGQRYFLWIVLVSRLVGAAAMASASQAPLNLASVNAAVAEPGSQSLLFDKNAHRQVPIASLTKLMTALVVLESGESMDEWLDFQPWHVTPEANAYTRIRIGSTLQRRNLLRLALMSSENFATYNLARHHPGGYDAFVQAMNDKAAALGMTATEFVDPTGLSLGNLSSAADLVRLANALRAYPMVSDFSTMGYYTASFRKPRYSLSYGNTNALVHRESWGVSLSKTGYLTDAGRCLVMIATMDGKEVITVLLDSLGTRSPMGDAGRIKRWLANGDSGQVAEIARRYEREKNAFYLAADGAQVKPETVVSRAGPERRDSDPDTRGGTDTAEASGPEVPDQERRTQ